MDFFQFSVINRGAGLEMPAWSYSTIAACTCSVSVAVLLFLCGTATAQQRQTAQLRVELKAGDATQAFVDSVFTVMDRWSRPGDSLVVARQPSGKQMTKSELRRTLIQEFGIAPSATSHVSIRYRFLLVEDRFREEITGIQYYFMPTNANSIDMLYLSTGGSDWASDLLQKPSGVSPSSVVRKPFSQQLSFLHLLEHKNAEIQKIDGNPASKEKKESLVDRIRQSVESSL